MGKPIINFDSKQLAALRRNIAIGSFAAFLLFHPVVGAKPGLGEERLPPKGKPVPAQPAPKPAFTPSRVYDSEGRLLTPEQVKGMAAQEKLDKAATARFLKQKAAEDKAYQRRQQEDFEKSRKNPRGPWIKKVEPRPTPTPTAGRNLRRK